MASTSTVTIHRYTDDELRPVVLEVLTYLHDLEAKAEAWQAFDAKARREERAYEAAALRLFARERAQIAERILDAVAVFKAADPVDPHPSVADPYIEAAFLKIAADYAEGGEYHSAWLARYRALVSHTVRLGGREVSGQIGLSFTLENPRARDAINRRVTKLTGAVTGTTVQRVRETIRTAMQEGVGVTEIAKRIREQAFAADISRSRARVIARTESVGALNEGQFLGATTAGVMRSKRWLTQGDGRVRDSHVQAGSEGWIALSSVFSNGLQYPHDPSAPADEVIQCRCSLQYSDQPPNEAGP